MPVLVVFAAVLLGTGYGICIVSGLVEVQTMVEPEHLARATAVYYSLTYTGFTFPAVLSGLAVAVPYSLLLGAVAAACLICAATVSRRVGTSGAAGQL